MRTEKYEQVLDKCIQRVIRNGEILSQVIADYPQFNQRLRSDMAVVVWLDRRRAEIEPGSGFFVNSRQTLLNQLNALAITIPDGKKKVIYKPQIKVSWLVAALVFLVVYLSGGLFLMDRSLPGDRLYEVKTSLEDLRLALTLDAAEDARLHMRYAQEHLVACAKATSLGRHKDAAMALNNYERHIAGLIRAAQMMADYPATDSEWHNIDISRIYLEDLEIFKVLLAGSF